MKISEMKTSAEVLDGDLHDAEFRREWDRTAFARAVALEVLGYRTKHKLSQRALARLLGMTQPQLARLEAGEHNPTIETLARVAEALDIEFAIDIHPRRREPKLLSIGARAKNAIVSYQADAAAIVLATATS